MKNIQDQKIDKFLEQFKSKKSKKKRERSKQIDSKIAKHLNLVEEKHWETLHEKLVKFIRNKDEIRTRQEKYSELINEFCNHFIDENGIENFNWKIESPKYYKSIDIFIDTCYIALEYSKTDYSPQLQSILNDVKKEKRTPKSIALLYGNLLEEFHSTLLQNLNNHTLKTFLNKPKDKHRMGAIVWGGLAAILSMLIVYFYLTHEMLEIWFRVFECFRNGVCKTDKIMWPEKSGIFILIFGIAGIQLCVTEYRKQMHNYLKYDFALASLETGEEILTHYENKEEKVAAFKLRSEIINNGFKNLDTGYLKNPVQPNSQINIK